jgi:23S rRNA pseudouridine1911/1915/1917 synthase
LSDARKASLQDGRFVVVERAPLDRALRSLLPGLGWAPVRRAIESGKVTLDGTLALDPRTVAEAGAVVEIKMSARAPRAGRELARGALVFVDASVVVVNKPAGISSVPFAPDERDALVDLARRALRQRERRPVPPLLVVHRIDKETSGLIVFARTLAAMRNLKQQLRVHAMHRRYLALARGRVAAQRFESRLVKDRGDGRRGSTQNPKLGRVAITHVRPLAELDGATLLECRLETGRTHQIRIQLAEAGHPILGERVYGRPVDDQRREVPRLMLHAAELGFSHPVSSEPLHFRVPPPDDMERVIAQSKAKSGR